MLIEPLNIACPPINQIIIASMYIIKILKFIFKQQINSNLI